VTSGDKYWRRKSVWREFEEKPRRETDYALFHGTTCYQRVVWNMPPGWASNPATAPPPHPQPTQATSWKDSQNVALPNPSTHRSGPWNGSHKPPSHILTACNLRVLEVKCLFAFLYSLIRGGSSEACKIAETLLGDQWSEVLVPIVVRCTMRWCYLEEMYSAKMRTVIPIQARTSTTSYCYRLFCR
jgi:hypothetical protein